MSITGINSNSLASLYEYYTSESDSTNSTDSSLSSLLGVDTDSSNRGSADSIIFSPASQIYCRLQKLQQSDPEEFKEVCSEIAGKLNKTAQNAGGDGAAELAIKFASAAESGTMADLQASTTTTSDTSSTSSYISKYYAQLLSSQSSDDSSTSSLLTQILSEMGISL